MKQALLIFILAFTIGAVAQDSGQKTIKDTAEYNTYVAASSTADPAQKCAAFDSYFTTYPNSIMKPEGYAQELAACQQANKPEKAMAVADLLLQVEPTNLNALVVKTVSLLGKPDIQGAGAFGLRGINSLAAATKGEGETDAAFQQRKTALTNIFNFAAGRAALENKDWSNARKYLRTATEINPDDANNDYWLARAYLGEPKKDRSDDSSINGLFFWARVVVKTAAANPAFSQSEDKVGLGFYKSFHGYANSGHIIAPGNICQYEIGPLVGTEKEKVVLTTNQDVGKACNDSADGWEDIKATAAANPLPPAGFTIKKVPPPTNVDLINAMVKKTAPEKMDVGTWIFIFGTGAQEPSVKPLADEVWGKVVNKRIRFEGVVVATEPLKDKEGNVVDLDKIIKEQQAKAAAAAKAGKAYKPEPLPDTTPQKIVMGVTLADDGSVNKNKEVEVSMLNPIKLPEAGIKFQMEATLRSRVENANDKNNPVTLVMDEGEPFGTSVPAPDKKSPAHPPAHKASAGTSVAKKSSGM